MNPLEPYIPPHYLFNTIEEAQTFCDTVNNGENCLYVQPIQYDGINWGVITNEITNLYYND